MTLTVAPSRCVHRALLGIVAVGAAFRVWHYAAGASLWADEAAVARQVLTRSPLELLEPLYYGQVAPIGFLLALKAATRLAGGSELALRMVPFLAGIAAVGLAAWVGARLFRPLAALLFATLVALALPLVTFSVQVKRYSVDVAACLAVLAAAIECRRRVLTGLQVVALTGGVALVLLVSQPAVFVVTATGAAVLLDAAIGAPIDRRQRVWLVGGWALAVGAAAALARWRVDPVTDAYLHLYWSGGFLPETARLWWIRQAAEGLVGGAAGEAGLQYPWPWGVLGVAAAGGAALLVRRPWLAVAVAGPGLLALGAAALGVYPFAGRLTLFLLPCVLLLVAAAVDAGQDRWPAGARGVAAIVLALALVPVLGEPWPRHERFMRPIVEYLQAQVQPGDVVFVHYLAGHEFLYYAQRTPLAGEIHVSTCQLDNPRSQRAELDRWRGRPRVWVVTSQSPRTLSDGERRLLVEYLGAIGQPRQRLVVPAATTGPSTGAELFDLSSPPAGAPSSAADAAAAPSAPLWVCGGPSTTTSERRLDVVRAILTAAAAR